MVWRTRRKGLEYTCVGSISSSFPTTLSLALLFPSSVSGVSKEASYGDLRSCRSTYTLIFLGPTPLHLDFVARDPAKPHLRPTTVTVWTDVDATTAPMGKARASDARSASTTARLAKHGYDARLQRRGDVKRDGTRSCEVDVTVSSQSTRALWFVRLPGAKHPRRTVARPLLDDSCSAIHFHHVAIARSHPSRSVHALLPRLLAKR